MPQPTNQSREKEIYQSRNVRIKFKNTYKTIQRTRSNKKTHKIHKYESYKLHNRVPIHTKSPEFI